MWSNNGSIITFITRSLRMQRKRVIEVAASTKEDIVISEKVLNDTEPALPLSEDDLIKLKERHTVQNSYYKKVSYNDKSATSSDAIDIKPRKKTLIDYKVKHPIIEPITVDNQHERLVTVVTPLSKLPYYKQLNVKQNHAQFVSINLKKKLRQAKVPLQPSTDRLLCPMDRVCSVPDIINYRNKDEFSINIGADGNPKTVGYFVGLPKDPYMTCIPPTHLSIIRSSHKLIAHHFQEFIEASHHQTCLKFSIGGVWKNLTVRSTLSDQRMACVNIFPNFLKDGEKDEIKDQLNTYFFNGPGSECDLSSLYLQACPHTRCSRETAPYELIAGDTHITEKCLDKSFKISPDSFFQTNTKAAEILMETVMKLAEATPMTTILDVCCGTGTFSTMFAPYVRGTIGIDVISAAIEDAKLNSKLNGIHNTNFICGKVEKILPILTEDLKECSEVIAIVNPARSGLDPAAVNSLRNCRSIRKLIYVSCNPEGNASENMAHLGTTLPIYRNGKRAIEGDPFVPTYMAPIDIFPQTLHLEYVVLFERVNIQD